MTNSFIQRKRGKAKQQAKKGDRQKRHKLESLFRDADAINLRPQMSKREIRSRIDRELAQQRAAQKALSSDEPRSEHGCGTGAGTPPGNGPGAVFQKGGAA